MKKWFKYLLVFVSTILIIFIVFLISKGLIGLPGSLIKPLPAPLINEKIKGYWSSSGPLAYSDLNDAGEMKNIGINTITFSPMLSHNSEGKIMDFFINDGYVKRTINKAHKAGIRVMLETTPMNAGVVAPEVENAQLFQAQMTKVALKYAKIAEEFNVEYFAPIVEPGHHLEIQEADAWLQKLLPQLKQVYSGKIMWKKQSNDIEYVKNWNQDHILYLNFMPGSSEVRINLKSLIEHNLSLSINKGRINLEEYTKAGKKFSKNNTLSLSSGWHELKIEIIGHQITIFIDGEKYLEHEDDSGPMGGYSIFSPMRINKLKITDPQGQILYDERFENLNSFSSLGDIRLEGKELVIGSDGETKLIHDINFSGYDCIAIDTFHRGRVYTIDEYIQGLAHYIQKTNDQAQADGVDCVVIAEFGGSLQKNVGWQDADERAKLPLTEEELAETTKRVLELAEDKVDGYIYNGWNIKGQGINRLPAVKEVIRNWYLTH